MFHPMVSYTLELAGLWFNLELMKAQIGWEAYAKKFSYLLRLNLKSVFSYVCFIVLFCHLMSHDKPHPIINDFFSSHQQRLCWICKVYPSPPLSDI